MSGAEDLASELERIVTRLADALGRPVDLDDDGFRLLAHSSHEDHVDTVRVRSILARRAPAPVIRHLRGLGLPDARTPVRIGACPDLDMEARLCVPVIGDGVLGYLWLVDDGTLDGPVVALAEAAAAEAAGALRRGRRARLRTRAEEERLVLQALGPAPGPSRAALTALRDARTLRDGGVEAVAVLRAEAEGADLVTAELRRRAGPGEVACATRGDDEALALFRDRAAAVRLVEAAVAAGAARAAGLVDVVSPEPEPALGVLLARAEHAAAVAAGPAGVSRVARWEELGALRYLADHERRFGTPAEHEPALAELAGTDAGRELLRTVERYLDLAGDARAAAEQLALHRSSLYHRLSRAEELLALDLRDGRARLRIHMGLKAARFAGLLGDDRAPGAR
ncbi:MAG TPA: helix-turn-helix domain-containing protein [Baekduia sp.]|uniref:helix-turn-helix domain-containing protein n=1 Tax=Baekduia sp. TaxID=2600305 RepID=UPI002D76C59E|nr:helix-turn-helix domain-containing protein [Baekduia sp.]HET6505326.1 helix-turn-helix domain-containing protein [Baekduia sp.]